MTNNENYDDFDNVWKAVMNINVCQTRDEEFDVSVSEVFDLVIKNELKELVKNYRPLKSKDTGIKMQILFVDFRLFNRKIIKDRNPLPLIED